MLCFFNDSCVGSVEKYCESGGCGGRCSEEKSKIARRCGEKHIWKWKCTKHQGAGALFEVLMSKNCTPLCNSISSPKTIMTMEHPPLKKMHVLLKKGIFQKVMLVFWLYLPFQSLTIYLQRRGPSHPQQVPGRELMVTEDHTRCILVKQFYEFRFIESSFCFLIFTSGLSCRRRFTWMICPSPNSG